MHGPGATERYLGPTDVGSTERVEFGTGKSNVLHKSNRAVFGNRTGILGQDDRLGSL